MIEVNLFVYGWVNPVLAFVMSTLGSLLAVVLATKARGRSGRARVRLVAYAAVALGGIGLFQGQFLALLGYGRTGVLLRYHSPTLLVGVGVAIVAAALGLSLVSFGRPGGPRRVIAAGAIGAGAAAAHYLAVQGIRAAGYLYYEPVRLLAATAIEALIAGGIVWIILSSRGMRSAVLVASGAGAGICAAHYLAISAVRAEPDLLVAVDGSQPATGLTPMMLTGSAILLGAAITAMLWFFTVGTSTVNDLKAIFDDPERSVEIEPWMIAEVSRRVALDHPFPRTTNAFELHLRNRSRMAISDAVTASNTTGPARIAVQPDRYPPGYRPFGPDGDTSAARAN